MRGAYKARKKDEFISKASHELRTPLAILKLQLQLLQHQGLSQKRRDDEETFLLNVRNDCLKQVVKIEQVIQEILDFAKENHNTHV